VPRHLFIGDIHGCIDELRDLLDRAALHKDDVVVSLGDLVRKGPDPGGCARLIRDRGYYAILGNNEAMLLRRRRSLFGWLLSNAGDTRQIADDELMDFCATLPLVLDFPRIGVTAVHAGVLPNGRELTPELIPQRAALELRWIRRGADGRWVQGGKKRRHEDEIFWSEAWRGDRLIVYGHTPRREPRIDKHAIGIDTGCVYGGKLTGLLVHGRDEWELLQVPARRKYSD
jgi:hypothetical protein